MHLEENLIACSLYSNIFIIAISQQCGVAWIWGLKGE